MNPRNADVKKESESEGSTGIMHGNSDNPSQDEIRQASEDQYDLELEEETPRCLSRLFACWFKSTETDQDVFNETLPPSNNR